MSGAFASLVVWDVDGTLIPADLRWLRRAVARTYGIQDESIVFPKARVHGYTDESIVVDTAVASGVQPDVAEDGVERFHEVLADVMSEGEEELARDQPAYPGAFDSIASLHEHGFAQTVLTGNLRVAAEVKLRVSGLDQYLDLGIGAFGDDARERFELPAVVTERFAEKFGTKLDVSRTVVIGDAPNDIACARHAGFHVIAVAHRIPRAELEQHSPDAILDRLDRDTVVSTVAALTDKI
ncbi:phosphoglycolate phosphatase-like HAD superfamily hydrolase [Nocardia transvalensis]|uniref:Phosphoglycolate phosphatase-like HAD superfamily hydrolase n=1 Tax=Nocardia transvalensis TaxID=37333 RepID=A0A7W9PKC3_9NOCA|nr:haloacid dehalogenase-like hydrolase [Nocardia transvalensis]MBB5917754.1 phosphoglycolate phosphatase-like HAD superfamily hydrolase [Nocardia transvalensis]